LLPDYVEKYAFSLLHCIGRNAHHGMVVMLFCELMLLRRRAKNDFHIATLDDSDP